MTPPTAAVRVEIDEDSIRRAQAAIDSAQRAIEDGAIRVLLDGLGVASLADLKARLDFADAAGIALADARPYVHAATDSLMPWRRETAREIVDSIDALIARDRG